MGDKPVIIVGAGLSGLCAAKLLVETGVEVVVLEANGRVGGRTYTKSYPQYGWADLGGSYVGPTQDHLLRLAKELGIQTYKVETRGDSIHYSKGRRNRYQSNWPSFWWSNPLASWDLCYNMMKMDRMCQEIPPKAPWEAPHAEEWDNMTVQDFINKSFWTRDAADFAENQCIVNNTVIPSQASLLWYLWYLRQGNGVHRVWNVDNGAQERQFFGGTQQISIKVADILGDRVKLNQPVVSISQNNAGVTVGTLTGETYKGKYVILAIPPPLQMKIHFDPPLPAKKNQFIQRVPMGTCVKCEVWYKNSWWKENGCSGFVSCSDDVEVIGNLVDDCREGSAALTAFVLCKTALKFAEMSQEQRKKAVCETLANFFESSEALNPVNYDDQVWPAEPYAGGCYTTYYPPGVMTMFKNVAREPFGRLLFAGSETATQWTGYMSGAVEAGERAAREVLIAQGKIPGGVFVPESPSEEVPSIPVSLPFLERHPPSISYIACLCGIGLATILGVLISKKPQYFTGIKNVASSILKNVGP